MGVARRTHPSWAEIDRDHADDALVWHAVRRVVAFHHTDGRLVVAGRLRAAEQLDHLAALRVAFPLREVELHTDGYDRGGGEPTPDLRSTRSPGVVESHADRRTIISGTAERAVPGDRVTHDEQRGVSLRTVEPEDAQFLQQSHTRPEVRVPLGSQISAVHELRDRIESDDTDDGFVVCVGDTGTPPPDPDEVTRVGLVTVTDADWRRPELGYWLVPEHHGEGNGKAAVGLLVDWVFRTYDHPAVGAVAYAFNDASRGLLESLGFEREGTIRRDRFVDGEYVNTVHYGLLREDWWDDHPRSWRES